LDSPVILSRDAVAAKRVLPRATAHAWDGDRGAPDPEVFEGVEAIIHLAGEPVAEGRWTDDKKRRIRASRLDGTRRLVEGLARLVSPPKVLVCASAVGYYGDGGEGELDEMSPPGTDFLAKVCVEWEQAAVEATSLGMRVVCVRMGVVLGRGGGALARMLTPFRMGVGGRLGTGKQWMPWVALDDVVGIFLHAVSSPGVEGPLNAVAPTPVTNADFTQALGRAVHRPAILPMPALALRLALGEMSTVLLGSQKVIPRRTLASGYVFRQVDLSGCLQAAVTSQVAG
jgi:uncharacterized protein (TIGR01777 family)